MFGEGFGILGVLLSYVCLLFSLSFHEAAHAAMANRCGDPSARLLGRMTLNPIPHIDPMGTLILPLVLMFSGSGLLFGWAKPVPFNPANLRNIRRDPVLIALAGPLSNLLLALTFAVLLRLVAMLSGVESPQELIDSPLATLCFMMIILNVVLMVFNLIPLPPLDGHHVLYYFLPPSGQRALEQIGQFGIIIVILLVNFTGFLAYPVHLVSMAIFWLALAGTGS